MTFERIDDRAALTVHVEGLPDDGLPGWWSMARDGWRDTVDRLAAELAAAAT